MNAGETCRAAWARYQAAQTAEREAYAAFRASGTCADDLAFDAAIVEREAAYAAWRAARLDGWTSVDGGAS